MNNDELAKEIGKRLVGKSHLLGVSYGCPYFDGLDELVEELKNILDEVNLK